MSIWASRVTLHDDQRVAEPALGAPYLGCLTMSYQHGREVYAQDGLLLDLERGGWLDLATQPGFVDLARLSVARDGEGLSDEVELFLDERQVAALVAAGQAWLEEQARARRAVSS